jgi:hypothetical protein
VGGAGLDWTGIRFGGASAGMKLGYALSRHRIGFEETAATEFSPELATALAGQQYYMWRQEFTAQLTLSF